MLYAYSRKIFTLSCGFLDNATPFNKGMRQVSEYIEDAVILRKIGRDKFI